MANRLLERLWIFDFDGTLSPLVAARERAQLHPDCRRMLEELVALPCQQVAVLSSRSLEDLLPRIGVPGVYLGGGSGMEWQLPDGRRVLPGLEWEERLGVKRGSLLGEIVALSALPGVEVEDKKWSLAIHTRKATSASRRELYARIAAWQSSEIRIFSGPEVLEIQLLPEVDKAFGVRVLCNLLKFDLSSGNLVYAGDDENDAVAMRWAIQHGGAALLVGGSFPVAGARLVSNQQALVSEVAGMAGISRS